MKHLPLLAAGLIAGCTQTADRGSAPGTPVAIEAESIRFETSRCFGTCPVYVAEVRPDGGGTFEGKQFTAVEGTRPFTVDPADYRRLAARLAPFRPAQGDLRYTPGENCEHYATDMPTASVTWNSNTGAAPQTLTLYYGCAREAPAGLADALREVSELLPTLTPLVGER